jgi:putative transposase
VGSAAFNGPFQTGDGRAGDPLTLAEGDRRILRAGQALAATSVQEANPVCTRVGNACGLPQRSRPDPGGPFAPTTRARRCQVSAWGVRLGL